MTGGVNKKLYKKIVSFVIHLLHLFFLLNLNYFVIVSNILLFLTLMCLLVICMKVKTLI
jgi:hypothetical protein